MACQPDRAARRRLRGGRACERCRGGLHPAHSSRGIGAGLLRAVEARCRAAGAVTLELNASYNAAPFYRANGYVPVRENTQPLADGTTMGAITMFRPIATVSPSHGRPLFLHGIGQEPSRAIAAACERSEVIAHTLPRKGPSTSILRKLGFGRVGTIDHPEDGPVWKWREHMIEIVE
jgi:hypothetical protein